MAAERNTSMSIVKAVAIILMVMGHAEGPWWVTNFIYLFHMPVFFIAAGYFFKRSAIDQPWQFVTRRFRKLYVPMVAWSIVFLLLHNLFFKIGLLNETYGNLQGGVTHPYTFSSGLQRLVHIVTAMAGYDEFLAGAFWFFRALLVSSIVFLVLYLLIDKKGKRPTWFPPVVIICIMLVFTFLKIQFGLKVVTVVQGGIRECWGIIFFAIGVLYRHFEERIPRWWWTNLIYLGILVTGTLLRWHGMNLTPKVIDIATLPLTGICGFLLLHNLALAFDRHRNDLHRLAVYIGDNTLIIFVLHIISFKAVAALQIAVYGMDWQRIGSHMVVHDPTTAAGFFILYTIAGVAIPLALNAAWHKLKECIMHNS
ncbi:MAG: acyltransferase family protein [Muribaculaceae bacterium]|nr:acyltransferase family protein [Muribaculaceae bacterium]